MAKPRITIIGLGVTGASLGLGLQKEAGNFEIVGHDKDPQVGQEARRQGAVERVEWNLHRACDKADLIMLAVPLSELPDLFNHLRPDLKPETLIFAIVNVLQPAIDLAAKHLSPETHFVAGHPILSGIGAPLTVRIDLFDEVVFALAPGLQTEPSAVQLASDLVERLGAKPLFVDAQEHDGIMAAVEQLPQLVSAAIMRLSSSGAGWREARRLAGRHFARATEFDASAPQLYGALQANRAEVVQRIDQLQQELSEWRALLTETPPAEGKDPLLATLEAVTLARDTWEGQALLKRWDEAGLPSTNTAESKGMFRQMLFGNMMSGRRGKQEKK